MQISIVYMKTGLAYTRRCLIYDNYEIATKLHSKKVLWNCLRMCIVKNVIYLPNYKIVTAYCSKTVLKNRLRNSVINNSFVVVISN